MPKPRRVHGLTLDHITHEQPREHHQMENMPKFSNFWELSRFKIFCTMGECATILFDPLPHLTGDPPRVMILFSEARAHNDAGKLRIFYRSQ